MLHLGGEPREHTGGHEEAEQGGEEGQGAWVHEQAQSCWGPSEERVKEMQSLGWEAVSRPRNFCSCRRIQKVEGGGVVRWEINSICHGFFEKLTFELDLKRDWEFCSWSRRGERLIQAA